MKNWRAIAKENGIQIGTYRARINRGWSEERAATESIPEREPPPIVNPKWWRQAKMNGITHNAFYGRIKRGWPPEKASQVPMKDGKRPDRKWIKLAEKNGIRSGHYRKRVDELGWSPEKAATVPVSVMNKRTDTQWIKIAKENGISRNAYINRVDERFWDPEEAAVTPVMTTEEIANLIHEVKSEHHEILSKKIYEDPDNLFQVTSFHIEEAERNGIPELTFKARIYQHGWTIEEALTTPVKKYNNHSDEYFKWLTVAIEKGISRNTFHTRVYRGWSPEDAATKDLTDHTERKTHCQKSIETALDNGIAYEIYTQRIQRGWTKEEASTIPKLKSGEFKDEETREKSLAGFKRFRTGRSTL